MYYVDLLYEIVERNYMKEIVEAESTEGPPYINANATRGSGVEVTKRGDRVKPIVTRAQH